MVYAAILAGGIGTRVKSCTYPKQYYEIKNKPIIIYTLENILKVEKIDIIYVAVNAEYLEYMKEKIEKFQLDKKRIVLLSGGKTRMQTLENVLQQIEKTKQISEEDIILIHDAVRPFVTEKILLDSIKALTEYDAAVAQIPVVDTIYYSEKKESIEQLVKRENLVSGQSPDTFKLKKLMEIEKSLTPKEKEEITGTAQIYAKREIKIKLIDGDPYNFKITTDLDLMLAQAIVNEKEGKE